MLIAVGVQRRSVEDAIGNNALSMGLCFACTLLLSPLIVPSVATIEFYPSHEPLRKWMAKKRHRRSWRALLGPSGDAVEEVATDCTLLIIRTTRLGFGLQLQI